MDRQLNILIALSFFVDEIEVLPDILEKDPPLQFFPQDFFPVDLKIIFGNAVEDSNSSFGIGEDDGLLKIS